MVRGLSGLGAPRVANVEGALSTPSAGFAIVMLLAVPVTAFDTVSSWAICKASSRIARRLEYSGGAP
ncbi:hypothetical protein ABA31_25930 [Agrococcus baldri]|uniref:Uncharacterized protein n=1 Tax=Agrococcus baldri TaxID=153730 RepID=A0AA87UYE3_9MICO|nr:hypothetical protein ABA31_25930 [Agrococcus baldri]